MTYIIDLEDDVVNKDIPKLSKKIRQRVKIVIREKLTDKPEVFGKPLRHNWKGHHSLRVGDYRIIYRILGDQNIIRIVAIKHHSYIYE